MDVLVVEVRDTDNFVVCNAYGADTGRGEIVEERCAESTGSYDKDTGIIQDILPVVSDFRDEGLLGITF